MIEVLTVSYVSNKLGCACGQPLVVQWRHAYSLNVNRYTCIYVLTRNYYHYLHTTLENTQVV